MTPKMTTVGHMVSSIRRDRSAWIPGIALVLTLAISLSYLLVGVLHVRLLAAGYQVTIELPRSGGLLPHQNVTLHGVHVGRVESLAFSPKGVNVILRIDSGINIPAVSTVRVSALSPAGEQYVDFSADSDAGPFLAGGDVIHKERTATPVTPAELLTHADGVLAQVDPATLARIKKELNLSKEGPKNLLPSSTEVSSYCLPWSRCCRRRSAFSRTAGSCCRLSSTSTTGSQPPRATFSMCYKGFRDWTADTGDWSAGLPGCCRRPTIYSPTTPTP